MKLLQENTGMQHKLQQCHQLEEQKDRYLKANQDLKDKLREASQANQELQCQVIELVHRLPEADYKDLYIEEVNENKTESGSSY